ncbi:DNA polymerase subunit gamma-2, mitochondrial [Pectinophora gossypiella]|uniref:DNA polymerase subunit gamma-2, mitochondrial n=1 Tax=Pectinophora gossypiella TaxID=13191 RepID=UPI00214F3F98|nr:DNA polymerase subunit gamma-2, mitochondrial [Pectinophora gossypiella]
MRTEVTKILNLKRFFQIVESNKQNIIYKLEKPSIILMKNIHTNWLVSILSKTHKHFPVFLNNKFTQNKERNIPFGFISDSQLESTEDEVFKYNLEEVPKEKYMLQFNLIVPEQDSMQYFIQWQRYRKFWWSSITTTPSLFSIGDIRNGSNTSEVNIVAKFPWGPETVETLNMKPNHSIAENTTHLSCAISAEKALLTLFLDGQSNSTKEGYLRLHRKMAPFKISFALDEASKNKDTLKELASLLHGRLAKNKISTWIPDFTLTADNQLKENLQMGVAYTAVLSEDTLNNGIFHLLNSSTMLKEQVHVADFDAYAALIFEN